MNSKKIKNIIMQFCIVVIVFFAFTVAVRFLARQILVEKLGINNALTQLIFVGSEEIGIVTEDTEQEEEQTVTMDWAELYPFEDEQTVVSETPSVLDKYQGIVEFVKEKIDVYTNDLILGYEQMVYLAKKYESMLGWNVSAYADYNSAVALRDGHLVEFKADTAVDEQITSVVELYEFCTSSGVEFLYVQVPNKICKYQDGDVSGTLDFSQQVADNLLKGLTVGNVPVLDLREEIDHDGVVHHDLFYKTDHHWTAEAGLWAAGVLAEYLNGEYNYNLDLSLFSKDNFEFVKYEDWFLGSYGKKITLAQTEPEDISLIYPKYETDIRFESLDRNLDMTGNFSVIYNMEQIEEKDYYNLNPYAAYAYGNPACLDIYNNNMPDGKHVVIISDSFDNVSTPFLALGVGRITMLDRRYFNGSIEGYIAKENPDIVIVMYQAGAIVGIDWNSHASTFDFR